MATFYWKSTCTTCRDARPVVKALDPAIADRNYSKEPLTSAEIEGIVAAAGGVAPVLNTRHAIAKERGWKAQPPAPAVFVAAALAEPNLLRRPLVVRDGRLVVGTDEAGWKALLAP